MKRLYLLLLGVTMSVLSGLAQDITNVYLIGNAAPAGWSTNCTDPLQNEGNGIFTWTGRLKGLDEADNEGGKIGFRFILQNNWWPGICPKNGTGDKGYQLCEMDVEYEAGKYDDQPEGDPRFQVEKTGYYTIRLDVQNWKIRLTKAAAPETPELTSLFLLGNATTAGTDATKAIAMTDMGEGRFIWTGALKAGSFSFANKQEAGVNINPEAGKTTADMSKGVESTLSFKENDNAFTVAEDGEYTITVNLKEMFMAIDYSILNIDNLNIIGGALETNGEWGDGYPNYPMMAVKDQPGVYTISKQLYPKANGDAAELKFRTGSAWDRCFVLASDAEKGSMPEIGREYKIFYRALNNNSVVGDNKFGITETCALKFTIDLNTLTLTVEEAGEIIIPVPDVNTLYVCGTSFSGEGSFIAMPGVEGEEGVFHYEGEVKAGDFTFYNASDVAENISPEADTELAAGEYRLIYKKAGAPKFTVATAAQYAITVDLNEMKMTVEDIKGTGNALVDALTQAVLVRGDAVSIAARGVDVQSAALYDATGKCLNSVCNATGDIILGDNLAKGLYVVKMTAGGQDATVKVLVK